MKNKKTLCIDFDGVIHKYSGGWGSGGIDDVPMEGAKDALALLIRRGYNIVIFTARLHPKFKEEDEREGIDSREEILEWLKKYKFKKDIHYHKLTGLKYPAMAYIDDRAIRFTNWKDILNYF